MAKVTIAGEVFEYDLARRPMSEMLALERALGMFFGEWEAQFRQGGAKAAAGFMWLVWRRNGREVVWEDFWGPIERGEKDFDTQDFGVDTGDAAPDPTTSATGKEALSSTGASTSGRSPKS